MALDARAVMKTTVLAVRPSMPLTELEDALTSHRISGAPVIDGGKLVGIVSRSDIVRYFSLQRAMLQLLSEGRGEAEDLHETLAERLGTLEKITVRDIMVTDLVTVRPETPIEEVARLLVSRHVHRVLVTDGDAVLGLISALDLAQLIAEGHLRAE